MLCWLPLNPSKSKYQVVPEQKLKDPLLRALSSTCPPHKLCTRRINAFTSMILRLLHREIIQLENNLFVCLLFFKRIWRTQVLLWATDTPVLDFCWYLLWVLKSEWEVLTPADLLAVNMAAELFSSTYLLTSFGGAQDQNLPCHCLTVWDQDDTLPTELCWLGLTIYLFI